MISKTCRKTLQVFILVTIRLHFFKPVDLQNLIKNLSNRKTKKGKANKDNWNMKYKNLNGLLIYYQTKYNFY